MFPMLRTQLEAEGDTRSWRACSESKNRETASMAVQPELPADFLSDLDVVCPKIDDVSLSMSFLNDLETAYAHAQATSPQVPAVTVADLATLGEQLETWRRSQLRLVDEYKKKLPLDDPLHSQVSLFGTMDYGRLETAHTRTLAWLLGDREHGFGFKLLEAVLVHLLEREGRQICLTDVENVECEHSVPGGRIDILAEGHWKESGSNVSWRMVVEAKIDAQESDGQLLRYDDWLEGHRRPAANTLRVFLTPHEKRRPSSANWQAMTFVELASVFRRVQGIQDQPGYHFLRYYLAGVLRDVCKMPLDLSSGCKDPYSTVDYLRAVLTAGGQED